MVSSSKHAIVFGASGLSGWRAMKELLSYPTPTTFDSITGLTNRPLTVDQAQLPSDPRLLMVNGIDLTLPAAEVVHLVETKIPNIENVTHAYFYAYIDAPDLLERTEVNGRIVDNCLVALKKLSPRLEHVILQTGVKPYGIEFSDKITLPPLPWKESFPRFEHPEVVPRMFYYRQLDIIAKHAEGASWKWSEVRPDIIIGFSPTTGAMNIAMLLGIYFTIWRRLYGIGSSIPFPGPAYGYARGSNESPMSANARFAIHLSLLGEKTHEQAYNVGSPAKPFSERWPVWAKAFGLVGVGPASEAGVDVKEWCFDHKETWLEMEKAYGLKENTLETAGWDFMMVLGFPFDREFDVTKMREIGFTEEIDSVAAWKEAWGLMIHDKLLPPLLEDAGV